MPHDLTHAGANALQICLGADFDHLPDAIRRAHVGKIRLTGRAQVTRGSGLANLLANLMGMPAAGQVAMSVEGDHLPDRMIWDRQFDNRRFRSCFGLDGNRLIESLGPFRLRLRPEVRDQRLRYVLERVTIFGVPMPRNLAPDLEAWEGERDGRYDFAVEVRLPSLGRLVRYEGLFDLSARNYAGRASCFS